MHLNCSYHASIGYDDPDDFVRGVEVDVREYDECANEFVLGRFAFLQIMWNDIEMSDFTKWEVCDEHSEDLAAVYEAMMGLNGEVHPELGIDEETESVVVIDRVLLHPEIVKHTQRLLHSALNLFGNAVLVVTWRHVFECSDKELAQLGFKKVAETNLIYRHSCLRNDFHDMEESKVDDLDLDVTPEHEEWLLEKWEKEPKRTGW